MTYLGPSPTWAAGFWYDAAGGQAITTTAIKLNLDTEVIADYPFSHDSANDEVDILIPGRYWIYAEVSVDGTGGSAGWSEIEIRIIRNPSSPPVAGDIIETSAITWHWLLNGVSFASTQAISVLSEITQAQIDAGTNNIAISLVRGTGVATTSATVADGSRIIMRYLGSGS